MKYLKIINEILICIALLLCIFLFISQFRIKEDLNGDGVVDSADLLYLRQYLIKQNERNCYGKNK